MKRIIVLFFIAVGCSIFACNSGGSDKPADTATTTPDPNGEKIPTPGGDGPAGGWDRAGPP